MSECSQTKKYNIDDYVVYGREGICKIIDIRLEAFGGIEKREYYILEPLYNKNSVSYIPVDAPELMTKMRNVLTPVEVDKVIDMSEEYNDKWIENTNERYEKFRDIISNGSCTDILRIMKQLFIHKEEVAKINRKFYANDDKILTDAQRIITDEFSFVLGIDRKDVIPYIRNRIAEK